MTAPLVPATLDEMTAAILRASMRAKVTAPVVFARDELVPLWDEIIRLRRIENSQRNLLEHALELARDGLDVERYLLDEGVEIAPDPAGAVFDEDPPKKGRA